MRCFLWSTGSKPSVRNTGSRRGLADDWKFQGRRSFIENGRYNPSILLAFKSRHISNCPSKKIFLYEEEAIWKQHTSNSRHLRLFGDNSAVNSRFIFAPLSYDTLSGIGYGFGVAILVIILGKWIIPFWFENGIGRNRTEKRNRSERRTQHPYPRKGWGENNTGIVFYAVNAHDFFLRIMGVDLIVISLHSPQLMWLNWFRLSSWRITIQKLVKLRLSNRMVLFA